MRLGEKGRDRRIADVLALVEIHFENVRAVLHKCENGLIVYLVTVVQLELFEVEANSQQE